MKIKTVTMTGADNSIDPKDLIAISQEFPFVEWGILLSKSQSGSRRVPDKKWMSQLLQLSDDHSLDEQINLSAHLCGRWVRELLQGEIFDLAKFMGRSLGMFQRIQINTHAEPHNVEAKAFLEALKGINRQTIIQFDDVNNHLYYLVREAGIDVSPLFDLSHGAGMLPQEWPAPITEYCGYAGGLGLDNLVEELQKIENKVDDKTIWIDMETKVRSDNDMVFDLKKVRKCLEIVQKHESRYINI